MSQNNRVLLFDLGNILVSLNAVSAIWQRGSSAGGSVSTDHFWSSSKAVHDYESGRLPTLKAFYEALRTEHPIDVSEDEFYLIFRNVIGDVFPGTQALLSALRHEYPLYLLSNTSAAHWAICCDEQKLDVFFCKAFLSFKMGVMKPDPRAFQQTIVEMNSDPQNIWFYDDREDNVMIARKLGINAHVSFGGETLYNDLRNHGFITEAVLQVVQNREKERN
jgi:putative hydrolase of the HAD superfamily